MDMKNIEICKEKDMQNDKKDINEKLKELDEEKIKRILKLSPFPFPGN